MDASKVIVITGANDGIGAAAARPLAWSAAPVWQMVTTAARRPRSTSGSSGSGGTGARRRWMSCPWSGRVPRKWRAGPAAGAGCAVSLSVAMRPAPSLAARPAARLSPSVLADVSRRFARADGEQSMIIV